MGDLSWRLPGVVLLGVLCTPLVTKASSAPCLGDCSGDCVVVVSELIRGVNIALGQAAVDSCPAMDSNGSDAVEVNELIAAVGNTLGGCPAECAAVPTPTPTPIPGTLTPVLQTPTPGGNCSTDADCPGRRCCQQDDLGCDFLTCSDICRSDADCNGQHCCRGDEVACSPGRCAGTPTPLPTTAPGTPTPGGPCTEDADCSGQLCCKFGDVGCVFDTCSDICRNDSQCGAGEACCIVGDLFCTLNHCLEKRPDGDGVSGEGSCTRGGICASGVCTGGFCGGGCEDDAGCEGGQFCCQFGDALCALGHCVDKRDLLGACIRDASCVSATCVAGLCEACVEDASCSEGQFCCKLGDVGCLLGQCVDRRDVLGACVRDASCLTDRCVAGLCQECLGDDNCSADQFCCQVGDVGCLLNHCTDKRDVLDVCIRNPSCRSDTCVAGLCQECLTDDNCNADQFCCQVGDVDCLLNHCVDKRGTLGACLRNPTCRSDKCVAGLCQECTVDGDCSAEQFCCLPGDVGCLLNQCADKRGLRGACIRDASCGSETCVAGLCQECRVDGECPGSQRCCQVGDVGCLLNTCADICRNDAQCGAGNTCCIVGDAGCSLNTCFTKRGAGNACIRDGTCASGRCRNGLCAECDTDANCSANQFCCVVGDIGCLLNRCADKRGVPGACIRNPTCLSGACVAGLCQECDDDVDCPGTELCCRPGDIGCTLNRCSDICRNDGQCASGRFCCVLGDTFCALNSCTDKRGFLGACSRGGSCTSGSCFAGLCSAP